MYLRMRLYININNKLFNQNHILSLIRLQTALNLSQDHREESLHT